MKGYYLMRKYKFDKKWRTQALNSKNSEGTTTFFVLQVNNRETPLNFLELLSGNTTRNFSEEGIFRADLFDLNNSSTRHERNTL